MPGRNSTESLDKIQQLLHADPAKMDQINKAIDYASKEVLVIQSGMQAQIGSFSCTHSSDSDSVESSQYSSQQEAKSLKSFSQQELREKPLSEGKEQRVSIARSIRDFYI